MCGDTEDYLDDLGRLFVENLKRYCNGEPLDNIVDKSLGFVSTPEWNVSANAEDWPAARLACLMPLGDDLAD